MMAKHGRNGNTPAADGDELAPLYADPGSRSSEGRPGPVHEEFWNAIVEMVREEVFASMPTVGTVVGHDGGTIRVQVDDEDDEREIGIPRVRGMRHEVGDRVKVTPLRGGDLIAEGSLSTKEGYDPAVDFEDLHKDSVRAEQLKQNSVTNDAIEPGAVTQDSIGGTNLDRRINTVENAASAAGSAVTALDNRIYQGQNSLEARMTDVRQKVFGGGGHGSGLQGDVNDIKRSIGNQGLAGDISNLKSDLGGVKSDASRAKDDARTALDKIDKLENRIDKLESRK